MRVVEGRTTVDDVGEFLAHVRAVADEHDVVVQAFDARYVAGRDHLAAAVDRAARATRRGDAIARDPAVEILLYAAGRRQIDDALGMGVRTGDVPVVAVVVDGFPDDWETETGRENRAADALAAQWDEATVLDAADETRVCEFFDVTDPERAATDATLAQLVVERVALLSVNR